MLFSQLSSLWITQIRFKKDITGRRVLSKGSKADIKDKILCSDDDSSQAQTNKQSAFHSSTQSRTQISRENYTRALTQEKFVLRRAEAQCNEHVQLSCPCRSFSTSYLVELLQILIYCWSGCISSTFV